MIYILNFTVAFNIERRVLALKNNGCLSIELSKPATRLLEKLINNNRVNLTRDEILKSVWEDYGFSPSGASLNNHICELRKAFTNLGIQKSIIHTVPRIGFIMDADIHLMQESLDTVKEAGEPTAKVISSVAEPDVSSKKKHKAIILSLIIIMLMVANAVGVAQWVSFKKDGARFFITYQKCSIYSLNYSKKYAEHAAIIVNEMLGNGIDCSQDNVDIFYTEKYPEKKRVKINMIVACRKNDDDYKKCISYLMDD